MKKNGFVMIETIVVITILSVGLISLYVSYSLILTKAKMKSNYDNIEYIYKAYFVGDYLKKNILPSIPYPTYNTNYVSLVTTDMKDKFKIEQIYLITNSNHTDFNANFLEYDGAMIAYIRNGFDFKTGKLNIIVKFMIDEDGEDSPRKQIRFASVAI